MFALGVGSMARAAPAFDWGGTSKRPDTASSWPRRAARSGRKWAVLRLLLLSPRSVVVLGWAYCLLNVVGQKRQQVATFLYLVRDVPIEFIEHFEAVAPIVILAGLSRIKEPSPSSGARRARRPLCSVFRGTNGQTSGPSWMRRLRALFVRRHLPIRSTGVDRYLLNARQRRSPADSRLTICPGGTQ